MVFNDGEMISMRYLTMYKMLYTDRAYMHISFIILKLVFDIDTVSSISLISMLHRVLDIIHP